MSILIKGMEMPKESRLTLQISADGAVYVVNSCSITAETYTTDAVPVPPHGRLIDADAPYLDYPKPRKPITNADRILAMTDEELAELIGTDQRNGGCPNGGARNCQESCVKCWLDWLREEVDHVD